MAKMPRLPVPPLQSTCALYLKTIKPFVSSEELAENEALVADFTRPGGEGERLRRLLVEYAAGEENWLERWWDNSYLDIREWEWGAALRAVPDVFSIVNASASKLSLFRPPSQATPAL